jgi:hypothetical protein
MPSPKGTEMMRLFADHKDRYLAETIHQKSPEMIRLIETIAINHGLPVSVILKKFKNRDITPLTMWEKISGFWYETKLIVGSALVSLWNYLRSWIR